MQTLFDVTITAIATTFIILLMSGCSSSTGWNVNFGINPITKVSDHSYLDSKKVKIEQARY